MNNWVSIEGYKTSPPHRECRQGQVLVKRSTSLQALRYGRGQSTATTTAHSATAVQQVTMVKNRKENVGTCRVKHGALRFYISRSPPEWKDWRDLAPFVLSGRISSAGLFLQLQGCQGFTEPVLSTLRYKINSIKEVIVETKVFSIPQKIKLIPYTCPLGLSKRPFSASICKVFFIFSFFIPFEKVLFPAEYLQSDFAVAKTDQIKF